jgi:hypothetical protein
MGEIAYEGLNQILTALKELEADTYLQLKDDLRQVGDVVRDDARHRFTGGVARSASVQTTAMGFETRVRTGAVDVVVVAQKLRKTTGLRPDWGALMMTKALIPARSAQYPRALQILEEGAVKVLREHGF